MIGSYNAREQLEFCETELTPECRAINSKIAEFEATYAQTVRN